MPYLREYSAMFDFLSAEHLDGLNLAPAVVFGRNDELVARAAGKLAGEAVLSAAVITGGVGKDTGNLLDQGYRSEAHFLSSVLGRYANEHEFDLPPVYLEERAMHGGENARFSVKMLHNKGHTTDELIAVSHPTSLRRLAGSLAIAAQHRSGNAPTIYRAGSSYSFNPANPADQREAGAEFARLVTWPEQGLLPPQPDLPQNLVDFITDRGVTAPPQPSALKTTALRLLPPRQRIAVLQRLAAK